MEHTTDPRQHLHPDLTAYAPFDGKEAAVVVAPKEETADEVVLPPLRLRPDALIEWAFLFAAFLGDRAITLVLQFAARCNGVCRRSAAACGRAFQRLSDARKRAVKSLGNYIVADRRALRRQLAAIHAAAEAQERRTQKPYVYYQYYVRAILRRRGFWRTARNVVFPLAAALLLAVTLSALLRSTFALEVSLDGQSLGYVENEAVYTDAKTRAQALLPASVQTKAAFLHTAPTFRLSRVHLQSLENVSQLCERLIGGCDVPLIHACGIYIDGDFLCAVRNEADASSAFHSLLAAQEARSSADATVAFAEEITYVEGLYPDNAETLWDSLTLQRTLKAPKREAVIHTVASGDHIYAIANTYGVTRAQLLALNPGVDFGRLIVGQRILVAAQTKYVHVKVMKTKTKTAPQPYETVKRESNSLPKGTTRVLQQGVNGKARVTELITYIDGKATVRSIVASKTLTAPVNEILLVGTHALGDSYDGIRFASGFIWPAIGAYRLSSGFGYRSARISGWSFHGGVDIVKTGGGSTGLPVIAAASGTVVVAQNGYRGYGHTVVIDHGNGLQTRYAHMQPGSIRVRVGQTVSQGQQIGNIGSTGNVTGPHLHFEVLRGGTKVNPMNYIG